MAKTQKRGSGGVKKYGRNLDKCKTYAAKFARYENKLKRIRQSNGKDAAESYDKRHAKRYTERRGV